MGILNRLILTRRLALSLLYFILLFAGLTFLSKRLTVYAATEPADPEQIPVKVLLVIYDPILEAHGGLKLHQYYAPWGWGDPVSLANLLVDDLNNQSHGKVSYQIAQTVERDEWPIYKDGTRYDDYYYLADYGAWNDHAGTSGDYNAIINDNDIVAKINSGEIDEVWMWGGPGFGWWEATTAGNGAYFTNGGPVIGVNTRLFSILGLNYQRTSDFALHSYAHGTEGVMRHIYDYWSFGYGAPPAQAPSFYHSWDQFTVKNYDPGTLIGCGYVHGKMNTPTYDPLLPSTDWTNTNIVSSTCEDWSNYPYLTGTTIGTNCASPTAWGCTHYGGQKWWLSHMPYMAGTYDGYLNNWWRYFTNLDLYKHIRQLNPLKITTDYAENNASSWSCSTLPFSTYICSLSNDTTNKLFGVSSVNLTTDSPENVVATYPSAKNANWNLTGSGIFSFWVHPTNTNQSGFQGNIVVKLLNSAGNGYVYTADSGLFDETLNSWRKFDIPLSGNSTWVRTSVGTPNLADIDYVEIHADTYGASYTLTFDGLGFVSDLTESATNWTCTGGSCTATQVAGLSKEGINGIKLSTDSSGDATIVYPSTLTANWVLTNKNIVFWAYSDNPNSGKFETSSPKVDILTTNSSNYYRYTPTSNLLNSAINRWQRYEIPVNGNGLWTRTTVGSPSLSNVDQIVIHSDTTGTSPYYVIYDGLRFEDLDVTNPTVSIASPATGTTVTGIVNVNITAADNSALKRVDLLVDGNYVQTDAIAPYVISWDSGTVTTGNHTLTAKAYDMAGNLATSTAITLNAQPDLIFADGFESGNFSAWSNETDTENDLSTLEGLSSNYGRWGVNVLVDNTTAMYVTDTRPINESRYRARFYLDPRYFLHSYGNCPDGSNVVILQGRNATTPVFGVQLYYESYNGGLTCYTRIRTQIYNDAGTATYGSLIPLSEIHDSLNSHPSIEIDWQAATAAGANDGRISLWVDGIAQGTQSGIDNDTKRVEESRFGAVSSQTPGSSSFYLDKFESRRNTYIGPVPTVIFNDGFEIGDSSSWSSETDAEGDLNVVQGGVALDGFWGLSALIDNTTPMYLTDTSPFNEYKYRGAFRLDPNSITIANGDYFTIFSGIDANNANELFQVQLYYSSSTGYNLRTQAYANYISGTTNWFPITDAPHDIELSWLSPMGSLSGSVSIYVDGVNVGYATLSNNPSLDLNLDEVRIGAVSGIDAGTSGTIYLDKFESRLWLDGSGPIFTDGLESGTTSAWSSKTDTESDLTVTTVAKIQGNYGLSALIDNTTDMYLTDAVPADETTYHTKLDLDPNSLTMASGDTFTILQGSKTSSPAFQVQLNYSGGYQIRTQIYNDAGTEINGAWVPISDGPHSIEVDWKAATLVGTNDGYISLWVDQVAKGSQSGIDNDTKLVDDVKMGVVNGLDAGTSGAVFLDTFESRDDATMDVPGTTDKMLIDGFESGNFSAWSSETDTENDLSVTTGSKLHGTYGLSALVDNTTAMYVTDVSPLNTTRYRSRFYFDPNSLTMTGGDRFTLFTGRTTTSTFDIILYRNSTSGYNIRTQIYDDAATQIDGIYVPISDAPHAIEIDWQAATTAGANNGSISLWVDGRLEGVQGAIDNDTRRVDEVRFGAVSGLDAGTSGTFYLDTFESRNTSYIGILEPVSDIILSDGFESGNMSGWSSETDTENDLSVTTGSKLHGTYGLSALIDNTTEMYVSAFTTSKDRYRARFYLDPNTITMANDDRFSVLIGRVSNSTFQVELYYSSSTGYSIRTQIYDDAAATTNGAWIPITDVSHAIEIDWQAASAVGANDGMISLWIDGVFKDSSVGIDNDTKRVEEVRFGVATGLDAGTSGTIYLDKFEARRSTYIGL